MNLRPSSAPLGVMSCLALIGFALAGTALAAPASAAVSTSPAAPAAVARLSSQAAFGAVGGVVNGLDGRPLAGMCVTAAGQGVPLAADGTHGTHVTSARTSSDGRYLITRLPAGAYTIGYRDCAHPGQYLTQWYGGISRVNGSQPTSASISLLASGAAPVIVAVGLRSWLGSVTLRSASPSVLRAAVRAALARTAAAAASRGQAHVPASARRPFLSGTVRNAAGHGVGGVCVTAQTSTPDSSSGFGLVTGPQGKYSFPNLSGRAGTKWTVGFMASCGPGNGPVNYAPQWWRFAATENHATTLHASRGSHFTGIDARLVIGAAISGVVRSGSASGPRLGGVCVLVIGLGGMSEVFRQVTTKSDGSYLVTGLGTGRYQVAFQPGCGAKGDFGQGSFPQAVPATDKKTTRGIDGFLPLAAAVSGTVTAGPGKVPLAGICVQAEGTSAAGIGAGVTSGNGKYSIAGLPAGKYVLSFLGGCGNAGSYAPQYYDGATVAGAADEVALTAGQLVSGINADMQPGGTITGVVTSFQGKRLTGICVNVTSEQIAGGFGPGPIGVLFAQIGASSSADQTVSGTYRISNLAPGSYDVSFTSGCGKASAGFASQWFSPQGGNAQTWVSVLPGATTSGIGAKMRREAAISGVVTNGAGKPVAGVCAIAIGLTGQPAQLFGVVPVEGGRRGSDHDGRYQLTGLAAGRYAVAFSSCGGFGLALNWYPSVGTQASARPVTVTDGHVTAGVNQKVTAGSTVSGKIISADPRAKICVFAVDSDGNLAGLSLAAGAGSYRIVHLAAGGYVLDVFPCGSRPSTLAAVRRTGIRVPRSGPLTGVNVTLPVAGSLSGTVLGGDPAVPVAGVCAEAFPVTGRGSGDIAESGADGSYTMPGLAPGSYQVEFTSQCAAGGGGFRSQWFNGVPTQALATPVQVTSGATRAGVDATLAADGGIAGTIKVSGVAARGVCAIAYPATGRAMPVAGVTNRAGRYQILGLDPGSYVVQFTAGCGVPSFATQWFDQATARIGATTVEVAAGSVTTAINGS